MRVDEKYIGALIAKAKELGLTRVRVADDGREVCIDLPRGKPAAATADASPQPTVKKEVLVLSQLVGYYRPVAGDGARVEQGSVVGIIESLGLPNDVVAPAAGTLVAAGVSEGDAVEYGTVLGRIE